MQIAQVLAGYTLGGADLLRRAMGKKKAEEMAQAAQRLRRRRGGARRAASAGRAHLRPDGEVRRLRLQQVALGRLRAALLPDRVAEGALPGGVHGGGAVGRHGPHRQGRDADRRVRAAWADGAAAGRQRLGATTSRWPTSARIRYGLGAVRAWAQARSRRSSSERERARPVREPRGPVPARRPAARQPARARGADPLRQPRRARRQPRHADGPARRGACSAGEQNSARARGRAGRPVRPRGAGAGAAAGARDGAELPEWTEAQRLAGERETLGLYLTGHPIARFERDLARLVSAPHRRSRRASRPAGGERRALQRRRARSASPAWSLEVRKRGTARQLRARRPHRAHRGHASRGDLPAATATSRQGRAGAGRRAAALR